MTLQVILVVAIGWVIGLFQDPNVSFYYGIPGVLGAIGITMLFALVMMGFNVFIALATRSTEATFLIGNFLTLPLLFTSSAQLPIDLLPRWMQIAALANPVTYAINSMRVLLNGPDSAGDIGAGTTVLIAVTVLTALAILMMGLATRRFRSIVS